MLISTSTSIVATLPHYSNVEDLTECFARLKKAGFTTVDCDLWSLSHNNKVLTRPEYLDWAHQTRALADSMGLAIHQTHADTLSGMQWDDPTHPDYPGLEERILRCIEVTKILGAEWTVVHPANLPHAPLYSAKEAKEANLRYLVPLIEKAKAEGIGLALENMIDFRDNRRRYCGGDPYELLDLCDTINDPAVGICIDTGHAHQAGIHVGDFIRLVGDRLKTTHINDNLRDKDAHLPPLYGSADWADIAAALKEIGYQGVFTYELSRPPMPEAAVDSWLKFLYQLADSVIN